MDVPKQLFTAVASSSWVERIFSTHGFVHLKIRNCLSKEWLSKLVTVHRHLNDSLVSPGWIIGVDFYYYTFKFWDLRKTRFNLSLFLDWLFFVFFL